MQATMKGSGVEGSDAIFRVRDIDGAGFNPMCNQKTTERAMLFHLFELLRGYDFPGHNLMGFLSFRAILASMTALLVSLLAGPGVIGWLRRHGIYDGGRTPGNARKGERHLGVEDENAKKRTPTMGGVLIILSVMVPVLLFCDLANTYILLLIATLLWMGGLGAVDDYIKVVRNDKGGLSKWSKLAGQSVLALGIALTVCLSPSIDTKELFTTIPFIRAHEFHYSWLSPFPGQTGTVVTWGVYLAMVILVIVASSNSVNLTDGVDGLAAGTSAIVGTVLGIFAWMGGNLIYSDYLGISYLSGTEEVAVFMSALVGALVGFLWFNTKPAEVFMGDVGSLAIGGVIGVAAVLVRKELLLPLLCGIFFCESLSVIVQTTWFKFTRAKYGEGRRIFRCTPLHHHFQREGVPAVITRPGKAVPESKLVVRFWIVQLILAVVTLALLKVR